MDKLNGRIEALKKAQEIYWQSGVEDRDLERMLDKLISALEQVAGQMRWIQTGMEKVEGSGPTSWNSLGELQAGAIQFEIAVGQAKVLADLLVLKIKHGVPEDLAEAIRQGLLTEQGRILFKDPVDGRRTTD